jgi:hypothetical protein
MNVARLAFGSCPICGENALVTDSFFDPGVRPPRLTRPVFVCAECGGRWEARGDARRSFECTAGHEDLTGVVLPSSQWKAVTGDPVGVAELSGDSVEGSLGLRRSLVAGGVLLGAGASFQVLLGSSLPFLLVGTVLTTVGIASVVYAVVRHTIG